MRIKIKNVTYIACAALAVSAIAGCQSRSSQTQSTVRAGGQTAPADLQLTCASEAASRLGLQNALPVSSSQAQPDTFRVDLTAGGTTAVCLIKTDGTVVSVERAAG